MSSAEKLRRSMQRTSRGWRPKDLHALLSGHGFTCRDGSGHPIYFHAKWPDLMVTGKRSGELAPYMIKQALETLDKLDQRRAGE